MSLDPASMTSDDVAANLWRDGSGWAQHMTLSGAQWKAEFGGTLLFGGNAYARRATLSAAVRPGLPWTGEQSSRQQGLT